MQCTVFCKMTIYYWCVFTVLNFLVITLKCTPYMKRFTINQLMSCYTNKQLHISCSYTP